VRRDEALRLLAEHHEELDSFAVKSLSLFGSVARDEAGPDSDIDVLVEFSRPVGLFKFIGLQRRLEEILGRRVDLVERDAIKRQLRDQVLRDEVRASTRRTELGATA
jgi:hypothetical protein